MDFPYFLMLIFTTIAICVAFIFKTHKNASKIGFLCWISLLLYFAIEYIVIKATTVPYNFLKQPMSDLGVTACGKNTYVLASYEICSPYHLLMNWSFTITGTVIIVGSILLHQFWPDNKKSRNATTLLVIFGLSYATSGMIPADVNFIWHTLVSLPGMFVQIPALLLIGLCIRTIYNKLSIWTFICAFLTAFSLILIFFQFILDIPGGLLQRILYGTVYMWLAVTAISLWQIEKDNRKLNL